METQEYEIMNKVQDSHWWFQGMAAIARSTIEKYFAKGSQLRILDAGCGSGAGMDLLSDYGRVVGFDISPIALNFCRKHGYHLMARASMEAIPFADESFDFIFSTDTLYFKNIDDHLVLQEIYRILVPGGKIFLRVPAYNWLKGIHDVKVSTGHRYTLKELKAKMIDIQLNPLFMTYVNSILFPFIVIKRISEKLRPTQINSDLSIDMGILDKFLKQCLIFEAHLIKNHYLPFGLSIIAVGQKPN